MSKKFIWALVAVVVLSVAYYLISPLWRVVERDDLSPVVSAPLVNDKFEAMPAKEKAEMQTAIDAMPQEEPAKVEPMPVAPRVISEAPFIARAHDVQGKALLIETKGGKILRFQDFDTINGPDLRIYLASSLGVDDSVDLGPIQGTKGNINYEVSKEVDTSRYNKVLVWCRQFSVLFSYAELK